MSDCPSAATLARWSFDPADGEDFAPIEEHINACDRCRDNLSRLHANELAPGGTRPTLPEPDDPPRIPGFVIERELGRGGMGVVYQASQPSLGRRVALKVVTSGPASRFRDHARWLREARAFSRVRHENVVRLHQVGEADGWLFLVLELIPGGTLKGRIDRPHPAEDAARLVETIAGAVAAIHLRGLVHLDLKPSNILIDASPEAPLRLAIPRIADFGIAYRWDDPDSSLGAASLAGPLGTPSHMAPEQVVADRAAIGPAADLYGLGALLYHLLTGRPPFAAATVIETLEQVRHREPVSPRRLNPSVPRDVETICLKCLQKNPAQRYPSAEALGDDLRRWLDGRPISARPDSRAEQTWRACRRHPTTSALVAILALTLVVAFLGMFRLWRQARSERGHAEWQRANAEQQRDRAEADRRVTLQVLGEMVDLSSGENSRQKPLEAERLISHLEQTREKLLRLVAGRPDDPEGLGHLATAERRLGQNLGNQGRWPEERVVLEAAVERLETLLRRDPGDREIARARVDALGSLVFVAEQEDDREKAIAILERTIAASEDLVRFRPDPTAIGDLARYRIDLARRLVQAGRHRQIGTLLIDARGALDRLPADAGDSQIVVRRIIVQCELDRLIAREPRLATATVPDGDAASRGLAVMRICDAEAHRLAAGPWAHRILRDLDAVATRGPGESPDIEAGYRLVRYLGEIAADERSGGTLGEALWLAERMLALSRLLVERRPEHPSAHLALSDAYIQFNKYAWRIRDRPAVERYLTLSRDAALEALLHDPDNESARFFVVKYQRKLKGLLMGRREDAGPRP